MAGRTIHSCVSEEQILPLADRHADVFIARPDSEGPWPVILFYMDAPGIRPELHDMARRLASRGYLVVLPNLCYRQGLNLRLGPAANIPGSEEQDRLFALLHTLSAAAVRADHPALLHSTSA